MQLFFCMKNRIKITAKYCKSLKNVGIAVMFWNFKDNFEKGWQFHLLYSLSVGFTIHWLYPLKKGKNLLLRTASNGEATVLEIWGMRSTLSLPILSDPFWPIVEVPVRVPSMSQIEPVSSVWDEARSDGEATVLEIWGIRSTLSLPILSDPFWPIVEVPVRVPSMSQIEPVSSVWDEARSDGEATVLDIWGMRSTLSLPILSDPFWPIVEVLVRVPSMNQIEPMSSVWNEARSDGEATVLDIWGMRSTISLSLLPGPILLRLEVAFRVPSMD